MADKKKSSTSIDALERVFDIIEGSEDDVLARPIEEVREELKNYGIDTTSIKKFAHERLAEIRASAKLERARAERVLFDGIRKEALTIKRECGPNLREKVLGIIRNMASSKPDVAEVYYRKFEKATDDDCLSLLDDMALLDAADKEHKE